MGLFTRDSDEPSAAAAPASYVSFRALTASSARFYLNDKSQVEQLAKRRAVSVWQQDAWEYFDLIGEVKYAFRLFGNVLAKIRVHAAYVDDPESLPIAVKDSPLSDDDKAAVNKIFKRAFGPRFQPDILRKAAVNLLVAGECYLVALPPKMGVRDSEKWTILSIDELVTKGGKTYHKSSRNSKQVDLEELPPTTFVGRMWINHPRYSDDADSSMRGVLEACDDMMLYTRAARASARSRLNAGAIFVPDTLTVAAQQNSASEDPYSSDPDAPVPVADEPEDDQFEQELIDTMTTPVSDESSAASLVPLIIRGPAGAGKEIVQFKFERPFDPQIAQRAERALERILEGIDLPKEIVAGISTLKYTNAIQVRDSLYSQHVEPMIMSLCDMFRELYLVPSLKASGVDPDVIESLLVWYDPSSIQTAPDKSNAANMGFDKFALSFSAWRRANGFDETDAPDENEVAQRLAVARGQLNDQMTQAIFAQLMPDVVNQVRQQSLNSLPTGAYSPELQSALGGVPGDAVAPPLSPDAAPPGDSTASGGTAAPTGPPVTGDPALPPIVADGAGE